MIEHPPCNLITPLARNIPISVRLLGDEIYALAPDSLANYLEQKARESLQKSFETTKALEIIYGPDSDQVQAAKIHFSIIESMNIISFAQIRAFDGKSQPWVRYDPVAGKSLQDQISKLMDDEKLFSFWDRNPEYRAMLLIVKNWLSEESDPQSYDKIETSLEALSAHAYDRGNAALLVLWDDSYVDPQRQHDQPPKAWLARTHLLLPLSGQEKDVYSYRGRRLTQGVRRTYNFDKNGFEPALIGTSVSGSGIEVILTSGEAFDTNGYMLSLNALMRKKLWALESTKSIFRTADSGDSNEGLFNELVGLYITHEKSHQVENDITTALKKEKKELEGRIHDGSATLQENLRLEEITRFFDQTRITDEMSVDIPAVITAYEDALLPNGDEPDDPLVRVARLRSLILATVTEYVSEGTLVEEDASEVFFAYKVSGTFIINKLTESRLVIYDKQDGWQINANPLLIQKFVDNLQEVHTKVQSNDPATISSLVACEESPLTTTLTSLFRDFKNHYQRLGY